EDHPVSSGNAGAPIDRATAAMIAVAAGRSNDAQPTQSPPRGVVSMAAASARRPVGPVAAVAARGARGAAAARALCSDRGAPRAGLVAGAPHRQRLYRGRRRGSAAAEMAAAGEVRAVILALHGFNDYSHAFAMPGPLWAEQGIATYAYDQRGFGGTPMR